MTIVDVFAAIEKRASVRAFKEDEVAKEDLLKVVEAGRRSPTARNKQLRKFTVIHNQELIQKLAQAVGTALGNMEYNFYKPNALILISVPRDDANGPAEVGLATQNMWLAATALGLGMVWTNQMRDVCDVPAVRAVLAELEIPENHVCLNALPVGIPAEVPNATERNEEINYIG